MQNVLDSLYNMKHLDELARKKSYIHAIHPLAQLITTIAFLVTVASFGRYEIGGLLPFFFYPVIIFAIAEIPVGLIFKRILVVEPLIIGIGILNPLFERQTFEFAGISISLGWVTFLSIFIKCSLTVIAALLLIATTGMDNLAVALRMLKVPKIFVLQLMLTYRYISVLMEEVARMLKAYALRAPNSKGINKSSWGSFAGLLLLRTFDRAQRVYKAMCMKGFRGEYNTAKCRRIKTGDILYFLLCISFFVIARLYNIPEALGLLFA